MAKENLDPTSLHPNWIRNGWDGDIWGWAKKKWVNFCNPPINATLLGIRIFEDDYLHHASKGQMMKNILVSLVNDVCINFSSSL